MKKFIGIIILILPVLFGNAYAQKVYITKTGTKYHQATCGYLKSSSIEIDFADAKAKGYTACSVCKPGTTGPDSRIKPQGILPKDRNSTVYVTKSGTKYHTPVCRYVSDSSVPLNIIEAIQQGYTACSVCHTSSGTGSNSLSPQSMSQQCSAMTKAGARCQRATNSTNGKCWQHGGG